MHGNDRKRNGFSLVELAIVLVILGLLVGGVMAGQSLIRAGELRSVLREADTIIVATYAFRDKYQGYPGDIRNATQFWGVAGGDGTGNDVACRTIISGDARTCNGNGNAQTDGYEVHRFWQQLANAGLLEGKYSGYTAGYFMPGREGPVAKVAPWAGWYWGWNGAVSGSPNAFDGFHGNVVNVFRRPSAGVIRGVMTGAEAWNLDTKADDGRPGMGKVISNYSATYSDAATACTDANTGADYATATYRLDVSSKDCGLFWLRL